MDIHELAPAVGVADPTSWVNDYGDPLYAFALAKVGSPDLAEDLVQETFLAALSARNGFRHEASVLTWLTGILRHKISDEFRRRRRGRQVEDRDPGSGVARAFDQRGKWHRNIRAWREDPEKIFQSQEFWDAFDACVEQLPPTLATAFRLKELEGRNTPDVCARLQISDNNLSVRMHRARLSLRECLDRKWFAK